MRRENFLELDPGVASSAVTGWNRLALEAIRVAQPGPLPSARSLAILHTSMYNAWAAYDRQARQTAHGMAVRLPPAERNAASKASAISHAAYCALSGRFPAQQAAFDAFMAGLSLDPAAASAALSPAGIGRAQAASMLDFCQRHPHLHAGGAAAEPAPGRWCLAAHRLSARAGHGDDQDVRLFFALANALADAAIAGWQSGHGSAGAAAAEVVKRFTGEASREMPGGPDAAARERGRQLGARAFEDARRYWEGRL